MVQSCNKGSVIPIVAISLTVIILLLLLVIDLNSAQTAHTRLQSSTDSASLDAADYVFRARIKQIEKDPSTNFSTWYPPQQEVKDYVIKNLLMNFEKDQGNAKLQSNTIEVTPTMTSGYTDIKVYGCATLSKNFDMRGGTEKQTVCVDSTSRIEGYGLKDIEVAIALDSSRTMGEYDAIRDFRGIWTGKGYKFTQPPGGVGLIKKFFGSSSKMVEDAISVSIIPFTTHMNIYPYANKFIDGYKDEDKFSLYNMMSQYPVFDDAGFNSFITNNGLTTYKFKSAYDDLRYVKGEDGKRGRVFEDVFPEYNMCKKNTNNCPALYEAEKPTWNAQYICPQTTAAGSYYTNWLIGTIGANPGKGEPGNYICASEPTKECQGKNCYFPNSNCGADVEECREIYWSDPTNGSAYWMIEGSGSASDGALSIKQCEFNVVKQFFYDTANKLHIQPLTNSYEVVYNFLDNFSPVASLNEAEYKNENTDTPPAYLEPILDEAPESVKDRYFRRLHFAQGLVPWAEAHNGLLWAWQTLSPQSRGKWNSPSVIETEQGVNMNRASFPKDADKVRKVIFVFGTEGINGLFSTHEFKRDNSECDSYTQFADDNLPVSGYKRQIYSIFDTDHFVDRTMKDTNASFAKLCERIKQDNIDMYYFHIGEELSGKRLNYKNQILSCTGEKNFIEVGSGENKLYNAVAIVLSKYAKDTVGIRLVE